MTIHAEHKQRTRILGDLASLAVLLGDLLARVAGRIRHVRLDRLSPFAVPMLMEIGKERSPGTAGDAILAEAESELIAEALA